MRRSRLLISLLMVCIVGVSQLRANGRQQLDSLRREFLRDSVERILPRLTVDTAIIDAYATLSSIYLSTDENRAMGYVMKALEQARRFNNKERIDRIIAFLGERYSLRGAYDSARMMFDEMVRNGTDLRDTMTILNAYGQIGWDDQERGRYGEAGEYLFKALALAQKSNARRVMPQLYNTIGTLMYHQHDLVNSIHYLRLGLIAATELRDTSGMAAMTNNLGLDFLDTTGILPDLPRRLDTAEIYFRRAVELWLPESGPMLPRSAGNIGVVFQMRGNLDSALHYFRLAVAIHRRLGDSVSAAAARAYQRMGALFHRLQRYDSAMFYLQLGRTIDERLGVNGELGDIYHDLAMLYKSLGDPHEAYDFLKRSVTLRDSLFDVDKSRILQEMQTKYRTSEKEREIARQSEELRSRQTLYYSLIVGATFLLVFGMTVVRNNRQKQRVNGSLREAKERAERSEHYEQQFLANMSHEIRTPMNAVMGLTALLLDTELSPKQQEYLNAIKRSSEHLLVIINDILDLSKMKEGKMELERVPFRLAEQIVHVTDIMRIKADEKGLLLMTHLAADVPPVIVGDPSRLSQILLNLVGNAIKFTAKGSVTIRVSVVKQTELGALLHFGVEDTGIGIAADKLSTVFESFKQAESHTSRTYGGTGLGLSISKTLVELSGGNIEVTSTVGSGSEFSFTMPFAIGREEDLAEAIGSAAEDPRTLAGLRVLLAEDNEYNRLVLVDTLKHLIPGVTVVTVANGVEAVEAIGREAFDVVLMDVQMPEMDGLEATRRIRAMDSPIRNIPIIALTASVIKGDIDQCLAVGMNGYVPKPFRRSELLDALGAFYSNAGSTDHSANLEAEKPVQHAHRIVNLDFLTDFTGGDSAQIKKYIRMFLENTPAQIERIDAGFAANDLDVVRRTVHAMKPQFKFMGMTNAAALAESIEQACTNGADAEGIRFDFESLRADYDAAMHELRSLG